MNPLIQSKNTTILPVLIPLVLACFALSPTARAVSPAPDGGYPTYNTAEGTDALFSLTSGDFNTAIGFRALYYNTTGYDNTANGSYALTSNTTGGSNTATGASALTHNQTGSYNTANGVYALILNTTGSYNTANGFEALFENTTGYDNTANGSYALTSNTTGYYNTANGLQALSLNTTGSHNTAVGLNALLNNNTGSNNIALGVSAGSNLTTGSNNIEIGALGLAGEANKIRIGRQGTQNGTNIAGIFGVAVAGSQVVVNSNGKLGVAASSARFKEAIKPMDKASEALLALKPVTFRYKEELDPDKIPQFGLIAEEVAKVNPALVLPNKEGKPYTVRYDQVNAMLLNEFLKEHAKVEKLEGVVASLAATVKEQASQIQKVSAHLEASKPAPQVVNNP